MGIGIKQFWWGWMQQTIKVNKPPKNQRFQPPHKQG